MNSLMSYKGYRAKIEFDPEDEIFVGHVLGINDSLNFHGASVKELIQAFHDCIENYLEYCKQCGKAPEKEYKGVKYPAGEYESLVITLGTGTGDNFWCVLFPPLCLIEAEEENISEVKYTSFIQEIINKYFS